MYRSTDLPPTNDETYEDDDSNIVPSGTNNGVGISSALVAAINTGKNYSFSSFIPTTYEDRLKAAKMLTDKENGIDAITGNSYFEVVDVVIMKASFFDENGKPVTTPRCILINPDGESISIMSRIWVCEFIAVWAMMGNPPFKPPLKVAAKRVKGNGTNHYYTLVLP